MIAVRPDETTGTASTHIRGVVMSIKLRTVILRSFWVWLGYVGIAAAEDLPIAKPEEVGLSSVRLTQLTEVLRTNIAKGEIPGVVLLIARSGKIAYFESLGQLDPQAKTAMRKDAIFRIYSMSKPITSVAAMHRRVRRGRG